jgi:hypothetical protein
MSLWAGKLKNGPFDIVIDSLLLLAIAGAYAQQAYRIVSRGNTHGLSVNFILFHAIYSNAHFANTLLFTAYAYPNDVTPVLGLIGDGYLKGSKAFGAILGLLQVGMQWACSIILVMLFAAYSTNDTNRWYGRFTSRAGISATVLVHAAIFVFPAMAITLPRPAPHHLGADIFLGFSAMFNPWVGLIFVILQFYPQYLEMQRASGAPGTLSIHWLGYQAVAIIAVAIRWQLRLGEPTWGDQSAPQWYWYQWGGLPLRYFIHGVGSALLLVLYLVAGRGDGLLGISSEQTPLLV